MIYTVAPAASAGNRPQPAGHLRFGFRERPKAGRAPTRFVSTRALLGNTRERLDPTANDDEAAADFLT